MSKQDKIREMILSTLTPVEGSLAALRERADLSAIVDSDPNFAKDMRDCFAALVAPVFMPMSDESIEAMTAFHKTPAALEMKRLQLAGAKQIAEAGAMWVEHFQKRLGELAKKMAAKDLA